MTTYLEYSESVEQPQADEAELVEKILASMMRVNRHVADRHRHGVRDAHAKSHGIVRGTLVVGELPAHLAQGLFARPGIYPVIVRFSTAPGDLQSDRVAAARGMAIKVLGPSTARSSWPTTRARTRTSCSSTTP